MPVTASVMPGPAVTRQTARRPVVRAQPIGHVGGCLFMTHVDDAEPEAVARL